MTLQDLRQFKSIRAEKERISRRLHELRLEATRSNDDTEYMALLSELYGELKALHKKQLAAELEITKQIEAIDDAQVRVSIELRYIDGYTWNEVADEIGGGNTEDACRKYVSRYLRNMSDKSQNK